MIAADGEQIAVARVDDYLQIRIRQFESGGERDGAAMCGVERVQLHIAGHPTRAANPRYDSYAVQVCIGFYQSARETIDGCADAAARTPDMRHPVHAQEGLDRIGAAAIQFDFLVAAVAAGKITHFAPSRMAFRISSA